VRRLPWLLLLAFLAGCGGDDERAATKPPERPGPAARAGRPVHAPPGWRTVENARAGFTIAVPERWSARTKRGATVIRSRDRLVAISLAADRSASGKDTLPASYARRTIAALPGFEGRVSPGVRAVRGSPFRTARVDGAGKVRTSRRPQRISVAAFQQPGVATFAVVVFRNARARLRLDDRVVDRMLPTLRAQRSGRSG
jgi:hypothetical protein